MGVLVRGDGGIRGGSCSSVRCAMAALSPQGAVFSRLRKTSYQKPPSLRSMWPLTFILVVIHIQSLSLALSPSATYSSLVHTVKGVDVPCAVWRPSTPTSQPTTVSPASYSYRISVPRIAKLLVGLPVPSFPFLTSTTDLPPTSSGITSSPPAPIDPGCPLIIVSHGYLGSRFDLSVICESLALNGLTAVSPEFPESLSASYDTSGSSSVACPSRLDIVSEILKGHTGPVGLLGHSLGTGLTLEYPRAGSPRCVIAGFRGVTAECEGCPVLVVARLVCAIGGRSAKGGDLILTFLHFNLPSIGAVTETLSALALTSGSASQNQEHRDSTLPPSSSRNTTTFLSYRRGQMMLWWSSFLPSYPWLRPSRSPFSTSTSMQCGPTASSVPTR